MTKISRPRNYLRSTAYSRDDYLPRRVISFCRARFQLREPTQYRSAGRETALDKIPPLFHLHNPQHLADLRLRQQSEARSKVCEAAASRKAEKIEIGTFAVNQG